MKKNVTLDQIKLLYASIMRKVKEIGSIGKAGSGNNSVILNNNSNKAEGEFSFASGNNTVASAADAHAEGRLTQATGICSHAEGMESKATNSSAHAEGYNCTASGDGSHAEGHSCIAEGMCSHTEGYQTHAYGPSSHAEGYDTDAEGNHSHAEGANTHAEGICAHAEGHNTHAEGNYSHVEGSNTHAVSMCSHAEGNQCYAKGEASHAEGYKSYATGNTSHAEGFQCYATSHYTHAEGNKCRAEGVYSHAEGDMSKATGYGSHSECHGTAQGSYSHAEGFNAYAIGSYSHAEGLENYAKVAAAHAEGKSVEATGEASHAEGYNTWTGGYASHAEGGNSQAEGSYSHVEGYSCIGSSDFTHVEGCFCQAYSSYQHVQGKYNIVDTANKYAHIVGNGNDGKRSNAHTLDWDGNAEFAGDVIINACGGENPISLTELFEDRIHYDSLVYEDQKDVTVTTQELSKSGNYYRSSGPQMDMHWLSGSAFGTMVEVNWFGKIYRCVVREEMQQHGTILGNESIVYSNGVDTGEPFLLLYTDYYGSNHEVCSLQNVSGQTFSVRKFTGDFFKQLDEKFIPNNIPKIQTAEVGQILEVNQIDENKKPISWIVNDKPMRHVPATPFIIHGDLNHTEKIVNSNMPLLIQDLTSTNQSTITSVFTPESLLDTWAEQNTNYTMYNLIGKAKMLNVKYNVPATLNFNATFLKTLNVSKLDTYNFEFINPSNMYKITVITKLNTLSEENAILYPTVGVYITMLAPEESTILTYVSAGIVQTMTLDEVLIDKNIARKSWVENITNNKITAPLSAEVNEILVVQEIDENGTPIKWTTISIENLAIEVQNILNNVI